MAPAGLAKLGWELWSTEILEKNENQEWLEGGDHGYLGTVCCAGGALLPLH
jgi:hypothetical protein